MVLVKLAVRNLLRNKRRTILTSTVVALGTAVLFFVISFTDGAYGEFQRLLTATNSGHIKLQHAEYSFKERMVPVDLTVSKELIPKIIALPQVQKVVHRTLFGTMLYVGENSHEAAGLGIDIEAEKTVLELQNKIIAGRYFSTATGNEVLVSKGLADELGVSVGDELTVLTSTSFGSMGSGNYTIVGLTYMDIYSFDNSFFFLPHETVERLLDTVGQTGKILAFVDDENMDQTRQMVTTIQANITDSDQIEIIPWQDDYMTAMIVSTQTTMDAIMYFIIIAITAITIFNTMLVSVMERFGEFGIFKALGIRDSGVLRMVLFEGLVIGVLGSLVGIGLAYGPSWYLQEYGWDVSDIMSEFNLPALNVWRAKISLTTFINSILTGVLSAVLASIGPSLRARKMEPVEALRKVKA